MTVAEERRRIEKVRVVFTMLMEGDFTTTQLFGEPIISGTNWFSLLMRRATKRGLVGRIGNPGHPKWHILDPEGVRTLLDGSAKGDEALIELLWPREAVSEETGLATYGGSPAELEIDPPEPEPESDPELKSITETTLKVVAATAENMLFIRDKVLELDQRQARLEALLEEVAVILRPLK